MMMREMKSILFVCVVLWANLFELGGIYNNALLYFMTCYWNHLQTH